MPKYILPDERELTEGIAFELNGLKFPPTWLERATPEMLAQFDIVKVPDPEPEPELPSLEELQARLDAEAWDECVRRLEAGVVEITTSAGTHYYSLGRESRENIIGINLEIEAEKDGRLSEGTVPNPRPWFPANATAPVLLTWDDLAIVGSKIREAKEQYLFAYFVHRANIYDADVEVEDLLDYDITQGWPS